MTSEQKEYTAKFVGKYVTTPDVPGGPYKVEAVEVKGYVIFFILRLSFASTRRVLNDRCVIVESNSLQNVPTVEVAAG
jgi:hypothetical protein